jgi:hypothetical protein
MRDETRFWLGGRQSDDEGMTDARVDLFLNWAYRHISRPTIFPHRELQSSTTFTFTTSDGDYAFVADIGLTAASNLVAIRDLVNESQGNRLEPRSIRQLDEFRFDAAGSLIEGRPELYALDGTTLYVYPAPSSSYNGDTVRLRYWAEIAALASSGAASTLATDWDEVIIQGAVWRGWKALNQPERAEIAKVEFGQLTNEVTDRLSLDVEDRGWEFDVEMQPWQRRS